MKNKFANAFIERGRRFRSLGGPQPWQKVRGAIEIIANTYIEQMNTIWEHVIPEPLVLRNSRGTPIFHFAFASNNAAALRIATDIVGK